MARKVSIRLALELWRVVLIVFNELFNGGGGVRLRQCCFLTPLLSRVEIRRQRLGIGSVAETEPMIQSSSQVHFSSLSLFSSFLASRAVFLSFYPFPARRQYAGIFLSFVVASCVPQLSVLRACVCRRHTEPTLFLPIYSSTPSVRPDSLSYVIHSFFH